MKTENEQNKICDRPATAKSEGCSEQNLYGWDILPVTWKYLGATAEPMWRNTTMLAVENLNQYTEMAVS
jgi:hypothetical protein